MTTSRTELIKFFRSSFLRWRPTLPIFSNGSKEFGCFNSGFGSELSELSELFKFGSGSIGTRIVRILEFAGSNSSCSETGGTPTFEGGTITTGICTRLTRSRTGIGTIIGIGSVERSFVGSGNISLRVGEEVTGRATSSGMDVSTG